VADRFETHPESLKALADDFRVVARDIAQAAAEFETNAMVVGEAFGVLGLCSDVTHKYLTLAEHTAEGLKKMSQLLQADDDGLTTTANNYHAVEQHNARSLGGAH
jgi:hypothetical protein